MRTEIGQVKFVATKISMSQQTSTSDKDQRRKVGRDKRKLCRNKKCSVIKEILSRQNRQAEEKNSCHNIIKVFREKSKKKPREQVTTEKYRLRKKSATKIKDSVTT